MMSRMRSALVATAVVVAGCGYLSSGSWDDDPENWNRAFRSRRPDDVVVVHSRYWRAPHWSFEAGYLFEIEPNEAIRTQLFGENRLRRLQIVESTRGMVRPCFGECPAWFAPKSLDGYDVWVRADDPASNFRVLIDKKTGHIFLGDYQF